MPATGQGRPLSKDQLPPPPGQAVGKSFYRQREGAMVRNSIVSSDSHLQLGHLWSDQRHLGCFGYRYSSVPGSVFSHFFEANSQNCGSLCLHCLIIMKLTSPTWWGSQYKRAHRIWLRVLSTSLEKEIKALTMLNDYSIII